MRSRRTTGRLALLGLGLGLATGCVPDHGQQLLAMGELVSPSGERLAHQPIDQYQITFLVEGETGEVEIRRLYSDANESGDPIVTDEDGRFTITQNALDLSYSWERDEYVCEDRCVSWEEVCQTESEQICSTCYEDYCWEECWDECWDETYCDDYGCWTETWCDTSCGTFCDTESYACDCYWQDYAECWDECSATVEDCDWVTRTYTSPVPYGRVLSAEAAIALPGRSPIAGEPLVSEHRECERDEECDYDERWVQHDRFVVPDRR